MASRTTTRPATVRFLAIAALIFPTILYIISLAMTLESIYNPKFALSHPATTDGPVYKWSYKASPFYICPTAHDEYVDESMTFNQKCSRISALGSAGMRACNASNPADEHICQKVVVSAELFVAGASLIGIALLFSFVVIAFGYRTAAAATTGGVYTAVHSAKDQESNTTPTGTSESEEPTSTTVSNQPPLTVILTQLIRGFTTLLAILSACCVALAQIIGVDGLVNNLQPTSSQVPNFQTRWYMGPAALVYPSVAYLAALLGAFIAWAGMGTA